MSERHNKHQIDMLHGNLLKSILLFAVPIAASSILQQLFNAVDVAVVGQFATSQDQAAVGCNGSLINLLLNLFVGISVGANVVIANYLGQRNSRQVSRAVHTSICVAVISGIILLVLGLSIARPVLELMNTPEDTLDLAILYLRIYFLGMPFIMIYNFGAAILRSMGDTRRPLYCLIVTGVLNAGLNMILVIVFHMGVAGVAIATVVSNIVSAGIVLYLLFHETTPIRLTWVALRIDRDLLRKMLKIGMPAGLQGMVFSVANVFIQTALNGLGSDVVAGSAITMNYEYITYFVVNAFTQTTVTFVSQNYGAGQQQRCQKVFWRCLICGILCTGVLSNIIVMNGQFFADLFTANAVVAEYARIRMELILTLNFLMNTYEISGAALRGLGYSMTPAALTIFGTCALRLIWIYTVFQQRRTFEMMLYVYPVSWIVTGVAVMIAYFVIGRRVYLSKTATVRGI